MLTVQCPNCNKPLEWTASSIYRPFCSERCRIIDLGAWANNEYTIPVKPTQSELEESNLVEEILGQENDFLSR